MMQNSCKLCVFTITKDIKELGASFIHKDFLPKERLHEITHT